jgi:hypothetical protein
MNYELINGYTQVYVQREYVNTLAVAIVNDEPKAAAPLRIVKIPSASSPSYLQSMLTSLAETDIKLVTLQIVMASLDQMYLHAMKTL